jgi:hypothetical protein
MNQAPTLSLCPDNAGSSVREKIAAKLTRVATNLVANASGAAVDGDNGADKETFARQALVAHAARIDRVDAQLQEARATRRRLLKEIDSLDALRAAEDVALDEAAGNVLSALRTGAASFANLLRPISRQGTDSQHSAEVARRALERIDGEIAAAEASLEELKANKIRVVEAAIREASQGLRKEWEAVGAQLRRTMTHLAGLNSFLGADNGRVLATLPNLIGESELPEFHVVAIRTEVAASRDAWKTMANAISANPRARIDLSLLPTIDPNGKDDLPYDQYTALERQMIDRRNV